MPAKYSLRHCSAEACLFWALTLAHLFPFWAFRYFPSQDGPAHLSGATILKDYGSPGTRYHEFFEIRLEATPNWTSHLLLAGLMFLVPPLVAEKILLSAYLLGFAGALRYFCGAFGERTRPLASAGLLFVFNRCIWLGFWNFGISLALGWWILGFWLRRRDQADMFTTAALSLMLAATFLTHLIGFLLTAAALIWFGITSPIKRWRNLGWTVLACAPAALLAMDYFDRTGFFSVGGANRMRDHAWQLLHGDGAWTRVTQDFAALDNEYFAHHAGDDVPMALLTLTLFALLLIATLFGGKSDDAVEPAPSQWPALVLALLFAVGYMLLPLHLSMEHGGFLKCRIALMPPLILLACFREPIWPALQWLQRAIIALLVATNLVLVSQRVAADNIDLAEYTAGLDAVGSGKVIFVAQELHSGGRDKRYQFADPFVHASQHYSLGGGSLNLDNYQASTRHFPMRYRDGFTRGRGAFQWYERPQDVDVILAWEAGPNSRLPKSFQSVFQTGRLEVFVKQPPP